MATLERTLYQLQTNPEARDAAFSKAAGTYPTVYTPDVHGRTNFISDLYAPFTVPAGAAANTPPQMSVEQRRICDLAQGDVESSAKVSSGLGKAVAVAILAITAFAGVNYMSDIKGTENHTVARNYGMQEKNSRWQTYNHGRNAPYHKPQDVVDQEVSDAREDGKDATEGSAGFAAIIVGLLALWGFSRMKK